MNNFGLVLAVIGLGNLLIFAQSSRRMVIGRLSLFLSVLQIPLFIASIWRISLDVGWWSVAIFALASFVAGVANGLAARLHQGTAAVYLMQPVVGSIAAVFIVVSWLV